MEGLKKVVTDDEVAVIVTQSRLGVYGVKPVEGFDTPWSWLIDVMEAHFGLQSWQRDWTSLERRVALNRVHERIFKTPGPWKIEPVDAAQHDAQAQVEV